MHHFDSREAEKIGLEKSIILTNLNLFYNIQKENLYKHFPYIPPDRFYSLLDELIKEGQIWEDNSND